MSKKFLKICCIFLVLFLSRQAASNAGSVDGALTLNQLLKIAYEKNPQMIEAKKMREVQKGKSFRKKMLENPQAEISYGGLKKNEDGKRKTNMDSFAVKQPLGAFGTKFIDGQIASTEITIADHHVDLVWSRVCAATARLYARILSWQKAVEITRNNLDTTRQFFTLVENRFHSGDALKSELTRARIEVFQAENDVLVKQKDLNILKGELNLVLGRGLEEPLTLDDPTRDEEFSQKYESLLVKAVNNRPDVKIAEGELRIAGKNVTHSYLETIFPDITVGFERTMEDFENDSSILLEFSYPLWGFNAGEVKEARAQKEKQSATLDALKQKVSLDVYTAFAQAEIAAKQMDIQRKAIEEANELLSQITSNYQAGEISFNVFLDHLKIVQQIRLAYWDALSQYREKLAELQMAAGETAQPEEIQ